MSQPCVPSHDAACITAIVPSMLHYHHHSAFTSLPSCHLSQLPLSCLIYPTHNFHLHTWMIAVSFSGFLFCCHWCNFCQSTIIIVILIFPLHPCLHVRTTHSAIKTADFSHGLAAFVTLRSYGDNSDSIISMWISLETLVVQNFWGVMEN